MTNANKYKTHRVAARYLTVGTVCYHGGEIVATADPFGVRRKVTFKDGRTREYKYGDRVRIYPNL